METVSVLSVLCVDNPLATARLPLQRANNAEILFVVVSLNKLLNKKSGCSSLEMPWHMCDVIVMSGKQILGATTYDPNMVHTGDGADDRQIIGTNLKG